MHYSPLLWLHIAGGTVGLISGYAALAVRKGSQRHILIGTVFSVAMLIMATDGAYLAARKAQVSNVFGGLLTIYMVSTAWIAARRADGKPRRYDWLGLVAIMALAGVNFTFGSQAAMSAAGEKYGIAAGFYFFLGAIAALAAIGDLRMLLRGSLTYTQRISRHLWRMCFGLFIAAGSVFLARAHLFPMFMRKYGMLTFLTVLPFLAMFFWLVKVRLPRAKKRLAAKVVAIA